MPSWTDGRPVDRGYGGRGVLRPLRRLWIPWLGLLSAAGCGGARSGIEQANAPRAGKVITADMIAASGAKTAWDAVRLTVPNVHLRERRGRAVGIERRGQASIYLEDQVRVILDNARMYDLQVLQQVAAADILTIEVLTGLDATTYYGGNSTAGAIVITTTSGRP
jgi:outer membrane receptor protein involved in Fe transport